MRRCRHLLLQLHRPPLRAFLHPRLHLHLFQQENWSLLSHLHPLLLCQSLNRW